MPEMRPRVDTIRPPVSANSAVPPPPPSTLPRAQPGYQAPNPVAYPGSYEVSTGGQGSTPPPVPARRMTPVPPPPVMNANGAAGEYAAPEAFRPQRVSLPPPSIDPLGPTQALPPPTVPVRNLGSDDNDPMRVAMQSMGDGTEEHFVGRPRRFGGWIVAAVLLVGVGVLGFAVAKPYLANGTKAATTPAEVDPRVQQFVTDGERALADGSLEAAKENFDKASALAEKDPRVLLDVARLIAARADVPWLRSRILPADATDEIAATKAALDELAPKARKAGDEALAAAPEDLAAVRARIDALRINGDREAARTLVTKVIGNASQPETAYVLAALDLAEPEPLWPMVIERLRLAATSEGNAGRARAALVYALARSGDAAGAKVELERLAALTRPYPLVGALRAYVQKAVVKTDGGPAPLATTTATVDVGTLPHAPGGGRGGGTVSAGGGGGGESPGFRGASDPRTLLTQAEAAHRARDYDRARQLYSAALAQNASDSEALAGLGDVAHSLRDLVTAIGYYKRALAVNPVYLPALIGMADSEYEAGNHAEAQRIYRDITERFPEGTYPPRVKNRSEAGNAPAPAPANDPGGSP
jgi:tetratricopeptide (TPR) repeat protein